MRQDTILSSSCSIIRMAFSSFRFLHEMFADISHSFIHQAYVSQGADLDKTIEVLLSSVATGTAQIDSCKLTPQV